MGHGMGMGHPRVITVVIFCSFELLMLKQKFGQI